MTRQRVLIIGGGIAGASIGSELAADRDGILLEAEPSLGRHSTGRSAALFMVGYGPASVQELTRRSEAEFTRLSELPDMPALLTPRGGLFTAWDETNATALASMIAGQSLMTELTTEQALELCPVLRTREDEFGDPVQTPARRRKFHRKRRAGKRQCKNFTGDCER